jgi:hypothetical protein
MKAMIKPSRKLISPHNGHSVHPHAAHGENCVVQAKGGRFFGQIKKGKKRFAGKAHQLLELPGHIKGGLAKPYEKIGRLFGRGLGRGAHLLQAHEVKDFADFFRRLDHRAGLGLAAVNLANFQKQQNTRIIHCPHAGEIQAKGPAAGSNSKLFGLFAHSPVIGCIHVALKNQAQAAIRLLVQGEAQRRIILFLNV